MKLARTRVGQCVAMALLALSAASAQAVELKDVVEKTIINNPEVRFRFHEFRSSVEEMGLGRAGFLPTVDLAYTWGRENNDEPLVDNGPKVKDKFTRHGWSVNLTQNLFQGFQTWNTVRQLEAGQRGKYFTFLESSEQLALESSKAYLDVLRYRQLLELTQDSYAIHKGIYDQLEQKVKAGVGRRVDLEQAAGRLALAETNMITEFSNLHDVSARYARLVGEEPPKDLVPVDALKDKLPPEKDLIAAGVKNSPGYLASLEGVRAARSEVNVRRGAFSPTVDLRARKELTDNLDGVDGRHDRQLVEVVFNINLLRGGADRARLGMAAERLNSNLDLRDKACRDMKQTARIANNDMRKLSEQMQYLRQHALSTEKARDAYLKQFDIGQRTLLDVLDSENELFDAKRALANAEVDERLAEIRVLAAVGLLMPTLKLKPIEQFDVNSNVDEEERNACNTEFTPPMAFDKSSIVVKPVVSSTATAPEATALPAAQVEAKPVAPAKKSSKPAKAKKAAPPPAAKP